MTRPCIEAFHSYTELPYINFAPMHTHDNYEIYCFLKGNAKYYVEGTIYSLRPGDILIMKKAEAHSLLMKDTMPYERIVINFYVDALLDDFQTILLPFLDERPLGSANRYPASMFSNRHWQEYLDRIVTGTDEHIKRLYLTLLLQEMWEATPKLKHQTETKDNLSELIGYINLHLTQDLALDDLCNKFYISKSHLTKRFKSLTGTTVGEYIRTKRLVMAKVLLQEGVRPTAVATQCGFKEYSSFFYAYKKKYGVSPKAASAAHGQIT